MPKLYDIFHEMHDTVFEYQVVAAAVVRYQADVQAANGHICQGARSRTTSPRPSTSWKGRT